MNSLHYLLMKSHSLFSKRVLAEVSRIGLTPGQPKVLECLLQHGEVDQKTIAAHCEIEPATVGSILLRTEDAGLIQRRQKDGNRRSLFVSLTETGRAAAQQLEGIFKQVESDATSGFTPEEVAALQNLLGKLYDSLQKSAPTKANTKESF